MSRPAITVRPARPEELPAVGELTLAAYLTEGPVGDYADELLDAASRARHAEVLVAVDERDQVVGAVTLAVAGSPYAEISGPGEAEFRMLAVAPAGRRHGVGAALVHACVIRARELCLARLTLSTMAGNATAHRLYERLGFRRAPQGDWCPRPDLRLIVYVLDLAE